jgi:hypothetical protein
MRLADLWGAPRGGRAAKAARGRSRAARVVAGLGSLLVLTALVAGLPVALYALAGSPVPHRMPSVHQIVLTLARPDDGTVLLAAVRLVSWIAWAVFAFAVLAEISARVRGLPASRLVFADPVRGFAAALVGTAVMGLLPILHLSPARSPGIAVSVPAATAPPRAGDQVAGSAAAAWPRQLRPGAGREDMRWSKHPARPRQYRVRPGDDLWEIAARFLGNGERWHEIFALNRGKPEPGGQRLTDPGFIEPGWTLRLPSRSAASPPSARRHGPARTAPPRPVCEPHGGPRRDQPAPAPSLRRSHHPPGHQHRRPGGPAVSLPGGGLIPVSSATYATTPARTSPRMRSTRCSATPPGRSPTPWTPWSSTAAPSWPPRSPAGSASPPPPPRPPGATVGSASR